jgi:glycosyltransferase involved in cell wall biosynthesis
MNIVFLYTELAGYTLACLNHYVASHPDVRIHLMRRGVNQKDAPFKFSFGDRIVDYERDSFDTKSLNELLFQLDPKAIITSGWMDRTYLYCVWKHKKSCPKILISDNVKTNGFKKQLLPFLGMVLRRIGFDKVWIPGDAQARYVAKMGFKPESIMRNFYSADTLLYHFRKEINSNHNNRPKRFLYVGRYADEKGIKDLWKAFKKFRDLGGDWDLWSIGTGPLYELKPEIDGLRHFGFVQPEKIPEIAHKCDAYILPSQFEPWGVSVHEMALVGMPLILSDQVGAAEVFLQNGVNGFMFQAGDTGSLTSCMQKMTDLNDAQITEFAERSAELGMKITPSIWSKELDIVLKNYAN